MAMTNWSCKTDGWLIKPMQGQGGLGIQPYQLLMGQLGDGAAYWQKFQAGSQHSLLFLAVSGDIQVIGFNTQWCDDRDERWKFQFSGIRTGAELPLAQQVLVIDWAKKLARAFGLKGLNTLDFIYTGQQCYVLEINPRPSASMQLYPPEWLFRHIQACWGEAKLTSVEGSLSCTGYQVIFANAACVIPDNFNWPVWCFDLPKAGTKIAITQPICSIIAREQGSAQLMALLQMREQLLFSKLTKSI